MKILNDESFANKMKNAPNPYGQGNAAKNTVDAICRYYGDGLLDIEAPDEVMISFNRKMLSINEDISVKEFEEKENALIHLVFDGDKIVFPRDNLNINGMIIAYDKYQN